jgi:uncharacterized protein involved in exopolysaccharide biosynthesis
MSEQQKNSKPKIAGNEIDYLQILNKLWKDRRFLIWGIVGGIFVGLFIAFTTPKQYKVVTTMLPQTESESGMGGLSSLAAIAGFDVDLGSSSSDISPVIYPQIVESEPFQLSLMYTKYNFKNIKQPVTLYDYLTKYAKPGIKDILLKYTIGLPTVIKESFQKKGIPVKQVEDGLIHMNKDEEAIAKYLKTSVTLIINKKEGYLTLTSIFDESLLTAQIAKRAQDLLQENITTYKTKKALEQLEFLDKRCNEKRNEYEAAQSRLASYKDRNLFVTTATGSSEQERLQNNYNLAFSIYSEISKQLETAKIKVKRVTPVYVILKPVVVPLEPFAPKKTSILIVSMIVGGFIGSLIVFVKQYRKFLKVSHNK